MIGNWIHFFMDKEKQGKKRKLEEEKPKISKREKKEIRKEQKSQYKPNFLLIDNSKQLWEQFKAENLKIKNKIERSKVSKKKIDSKEMEEDLKKKYKLISKLLETVKGKIEEISKHNDASRIIQSILKHGNKEHHQEVYKEIKGKLVKLSQDIYGHHIVKRLVFYGKELREDILNEFKGHITSLLVEKYPADVVDYLYSEIANQKQRYNIIREFYGHEYLFEKDIEPKKLSDILKQHSGKKSSIMQTLTISIKKAIEKGLINFPIVQKLLVDFFENAELGQILDIVMDMQEMLPDILHTKEGSLASNFCIAYANAGIRKKIIKTFKGLVVKASKDSYGYLVVSKLLTCIDDTILTDKSILKELKEDLLNICQDKYASKVIINLFSLDPSLKHIKDENKKGYEKISEELQSKIIPDLEILLNNHLNDLINHKEFQPILYHLLISNQFNSNIILEQLLNIDLKIHQDFSRTLSKAILNNQDFAKKVYDKIIDNISNFVFEKNGSFIVSALVKNNNEFRSTLIKKLSKEKLKNLKPNLLYLVLYEPKK